jgi:hypothetical protein
MDPRPGYTTSEFWSTLIIHLISGVATLVSLTTHTPFDASGLQPLIPVAALFASGLAQAYYNHSRGHVKGRSLVAAADVLTTQAAVAATNPTPASGAGATPVQDTSLTVTPQPL